MNYILPVRFDIKIKFGNQEFAAAHVQGLWQATSKKIERFPYLRQKFPKISEINTKEVMSFGPRSKQLFEDHDFKAELNATERKAWETFKNFAETF